MLMEPFFSVDEIDDFSVLEVHLGAGSTLLTQGRERDTWRELVPTGGSSRFDASGFEGNWPSVARWFVHGDPVDVVIGCLPDGATIIGEGPDWLEYFHPGDQDLLVVRRDAEPEEVTRRIRSVARRARARMKTCLECGSLGYVHAEDGLCRECHRIALGIVY